MQVQDVMSRGVATCHLADAALQAAERMWNTDCGCLPVVDDEGRAFAMVTDRDLCMAAWTTGHTLRDIPIAVAQSHSLWFVRETDSLLAAEILMRKHQVRRLPVLDAADRPIGMLSVNDLLRHADAGNHGGDEISPAVMVGTLAGIGRSQRAEQGEGAA